MRWVWGGQARAEEDPVREWLGGAVVVVVVAVGRYGDCGWGLHSGGWSVSTYTMTVLWGRDR